MGASLCHSYFRTRSVHTCSGSLYPVAMSSHTQVLESSGRGVLATTSVGVPLPDQIDCHQHYESETTPLSVCLIDGKCSIPINIRP